MRKAELKALTSLRGFAAMAIVLQHFSSTAAATTHAWIPSLVPHGYMAVDFFFVLSGFIMAYTYLAGFETRGRAAYLPFLYRRVARIFPLGIAVTFAILACAAAGSAWGQADMFLPPSTVALGLAPAILVNVLHLQGILPHYSFNGPSGSISLELTAYLLFPVLLCLYFHRDRRVAGLATAASIFTLLLIQYGIPGGLSSRIVAFDIARCVAEFGLGLMVYRAYRGSPLLHRVGDDRWTWLALLVTLTASVLRLDLLAALSFPPLVLAFALNRGAAGRLLASRVPYFLGTISFSVYLIHNMLRAPAAALLMHYHPAPLTAVQALLFAASGPLLVLPFASAGYYLVEKPGRDAVNSLAQSLRRAWTRSEAVT
jgi:peptidoglycan/LPS O-acetylase OafA/YrhL